MVLVAQRGILVRLRKRTFFDLTELNAAIRELLEQLNTWPMHHSSIPGAIELLEGYIDNDLIHSDVDWFSTGPLLLGLGCQRSGN